MAPNLTIPFLRSLCLITAIYSALNITFNCADWAARALRNGSVLPSGLVGAGIPLAILAFLLIKLPPLPHESHAAPLWREIRSEAIKCGVLIWTDILLRGVLAARRYD
jgi:hypothetical protein